MLDIIIPTLRKPHFKNCLEALLKHTPIPFNLHLIEEGTNFAEAVNLGIRASGSKNDVLILDDDAIVLDGWLADLDQYLAVGDLLGARLVYEDHEIIMETGNEFCLEANGTFFLRPAGDGELDNAQQDSDRRSYPALTTVALYVKRAVIEKIGLLNEEDFREGYNYEDWDFSLRAACAGFRLLGTRWKVHHAQSSTKGLSGDFYKRDSLNREIFRKRWFEDPSALSNLFGQFPLCETQVTIDSLLLRELKGARLALFGAGRVAEILCRELGEQIRVVVDQAPIRWHTDFWGFEVQEPPTLAKTIFDLLLITPLGRHLSVRQQLQSIGDHFNAARLLDLALVFEETRFLEDPSIPFKGRQVRHLRLTGHP